MAQIAAGLLMCRKENNELQFFLVHPGGPFYVKKNEGVWSIPKGIPENVEELLETAQREFLEETGIQPKGPFHSLGSIKQKSGKVVHAWAFEGAWTSDQGITSNIFKLEWPPRSKKLIDVPEVDRAEWMPYAKACTMIHPNQLPFLTKAREIYESDPRFTL
ncbi:MAG TPA: NUDIX domain-containing protein [Chryseolinea sp.]|nr:NUDIX domain-containing protein [Chryseolinea sp.]